jgi:AGCS family alanine or glycine:cation symporter
MKKLFSLIVLILPLVTFAQEKGMDEKINDLVKPAVDAMSNVFFYKPLAAYGFEMPLVVMWLVVGATFFTLYMGFINVKGIRHSIQLIRGDYDNPGDKGEVSHFQALVTALSGTVGLGNIAGVAVAISLGGAGATFWIILAGFLGMSSKFVECTLGVKYRKLNDLGEVSGGPMYYLSEGLRRKGHARLGKVLAVLFAMLAIGGSFGGGNMFQANQSFAQLANVFPVFEGQGFYYGLVIAFFVGIVIIGGIKKIASVTDKLVPIMVGMYVITSLIIITVNITSIGDAFIDIFHGAFTADGIKGGVIGVLVVCFQRAA